MSAMSEMRKPRRAVQKWAQSSIFVTLKPKWPRRRILNGRSRSTPPTSCLACTWVVISSLLLAERGAAVFAALYFTLSSARLRRWRERGQLLLRQLQNDAGAILLGHDDRLEAEVAEAVGHRDLHLPPYHLENAHVDADLVGEVEGKQRVLGGEREGKEGRREAAPQDPPLQAAGYAAVGAAAHADDLQERNEVDAGLCAQCEHLGVRDGRDDGEEIVAELDDVAGASRAAVEDLLLRPQAHEHGLHPLEEGFVAADHDGKRAVGGARDTAAHRRVQHGDPLLGEEGVQAAHQRRRIAGEVDVGAAGPHRRQQAAGADSYGLALPGAGPGREDHVGVAGRLRDAAGGAPGGHLLRQLGRGLRPHVVAGDLVAGLGQASRHVAAHASQADETDVHCALLSKSSPPRLPAAAPWPEWPSPPARGRLPPRC